MPTVVKSENLDERHAYVKEYFANHVMKWEKERRCPRCRSWFTFTEEDKENIHITGYSEWSDTFNVSMRYTCPVCGYIQDEYDQVSDNPNNTILTKTRAMIEKPQSTVTFVMMAGGVTMFILVILVLMAAF